MLVLLWGTAGFAMPGQAATNRALGGIGGVSNGTLAGGDGTGTAEVTLNVVDLALVKQARDASGAVLPEGARVAPGQTVTFILYVDNPADAPAGDVQLTDPLTESEFAYVPGTLEVATVASGASDAAMWSASWTPLTDAPGAGEDIASAVDTGGGPGLDRITVGATPAQPNRGVAVPAITRLAIRFRVMVQ